MDYLSLLKKKTFNIIKKYMYQYFFLFFSEEASIVGNTGERLPSYWCENEIQKQNKKKKLKLHTHRGWV